MGFCAQYRYFMRNELPTVGERTTREDDGCLEERARSHNNHGHAEHTLTAWSLGQCRYNIN